MRTLQAATLTLSLAACGDLGLPHADDDTGAGESTTGTADYTTTAPLEVECTPGQERCAGADAREVCSPSGGAWMAEPCTQYQACSEQGSPTVAACLGPCETGGESSVGCEFVAMRMLSHNSVDQDADADAIIVGNTDRERTATVQLYFKPALDNREEPLGVAVTLAPGEAHVFRLAAEPMLVYSGIGGAVYRVVSDLPISAYLHSPLVNSASNDASLLLPTHALGKDHIIASFPPWAAATDTATHNGRPSYFDAIALEPDTVIEWTPRVATIGNNLNVDILAPFETGSVPLNPLEVLQISADFGQAMEPGAPEHDVSGTLVRANKPIAVWGATACAFVPFDSAGGCNHLQEQMLPLKYWGNTTVAAHAPLRAGEKHYWRLYASREDQQILVDPGDAVDKSLVVIADVGGFEPVTALSGVSVVFKSNAPFLAVQYLAGASEAGGDGDPAMVQAIPVEQYLDRYVFVTGVDYDANYAQVIRDQGGAPVFIDGQEVGGYYSLVSTGGINLEIADWPLPDGDGPQAYVAESDDPFGLYVFGYQGAPARSAYAYPGGMALRPLSPEG